MAKRWSAKPLSLVRFQPESPRIKLFFCLTLKCNFDILILNGGVAESGRGKRLKPVNLEVRVLPPLPHKDTLMETGYYFYKSAYQPLDIVYVDEDGVWMFFSEIPVEVEEMKKIGTFIEKIEYPGLGDPDYV